jgi:hypothetical protein
MGVSNTCLFDFGSWPNSNQSISNQDDASIDSCQVTGWFPFIQKLSKCGVPNTSFVDFGPMLKSSPNYFCL